MYVCVYIYCQRLIKRPGSLAGRLVVLNPGRLRLPKFACAHVDPGRLIEVVMAVVRGPSQGPFLPKGGGKWNCMGLH